jgi:hypothetical protein
MASLISHETNSRKSRVLHHSFDAFASALLTTATLQNVEIFTVFSDLVNTSFNRLL